MQVPNVLEIVPNYNELPSGPKILKIVPKLRRIAIRTQNFENCLNFQWIAINQDQRHSWHPCLEGRGHAGRHQEDLQANKKRQIIKIKKIYRAKYRNELDDDLEEHVEKKFKPVVTFSLFFKLDIHSNILLGLTIYHEGPIRDTHSNILFGLTILRYQVRICVSDSREDEVDDEQVYQDVKGIIDAFQVNGIIFSH